MDNSRRTLWLHGAKIVAPIILATILGACGTLSNRVAPERLTPAQIADGANGIVLISTGADEECVSFSSSLFLHPKGSKYTKNVVANVPVDAYVLKSDFDDWFGFVNAFAVPAGDYYLSPWLANPYFSASRSPRYDFSVGAGEIVYLGQYHQPGRCAVGDGVISNQWDRDRQMISARNPNLDLSHVNIRLLRYSGDAVTGENTPPASHYDEVDPLSAPVSGGGEATASTPTGGEQSQ